MGHALKVASLFASLTCLSLSSPASAQWRVDKVCWGETFSQCPTGYDDNSTVHFPCGSGGHSGFNPNYACEVTCGSPVGPRCKIIAGPGRPGNRCGYRGATIQCF